MDFVGGEPISTFRRTSSSKKVKITELQREREMNITDLLTRMHGIRTIVQRSLDLHRQ